MYMLQVLLEARGIGSSGAWVTQSYQLRDMGLGTEIRFFARATPSNLFLQPSRSNFYVDSYYLCNFEGVAKKADSWLSFENQDLGRS